MTVSIRLASEADLPEIIRIYSQPDMDNNEVISLDEAKKIFKIMASYPYYHLFVAATTENNIVGTFSLLIMNNLVHKGEKSAIIEAVTVDPSYQNQGIGKIMMQFAMAECKKHHCNKLVLSSNLKRKKAHQFYESLGFKQHGISFYID